MERPPKCKSRALNTASLLPPELFKYICKAADSESRSCRLVCRYWNRQCTPHVFKRIDIYRSPERIRALWKVRAHPMLKQYVEIIDGVPVYDKHPKFPWIHLLTQICTCTQAVWRCEGMKALILLTNVPKRIRSIHFALPRSVPRSFSRGIRSLHLTGVKVRQIKDLTHLACELPDLEELSCFRLTLDSLPAELPRRRPRKSRNKLKEVHLKETKVAGAESTPPLVILPLNLFLGVYDTASFLFDEEAAVFLATLSLAPPYSKDNLVCIYDAQTRQLGTSPFPQ